MKKKNYKKDIPEVEPLSEQEKEIEIGKLSISEAIEECINLDDTSDLDLDDYDRMTIW